MTSEEEKDHAEIVQRTEYDARSNGCGPRKYKDQSKTKMGVTGLAMMVLRGSGEAGKVREWFVVLNTKEKNLRARKPRAPSSQNQPKNRGAEKTGNDGQDN